jgi:hypothetical protein
MQRTGRRKFEPEVCAGCGQTTEYPIALDKGSALLVAALARAIRRKGENRIHLVREMVADRRGYARIEDMVRDGKITLRMEGNRSRPRYHGLIAFADKGGGEYLLTPKGARFLRGESVPRVAVIDKAAKRKKHYLNEEADRITFAELARADAPFWDEAWEVDEATLALKRKVEARIEAAPQATLL